MISVIIPSFNREKYILKAIESVLNQTYPHFELIVVDDGSTDNSISQISKIEDKRMSLYQLEKNSGAAAARNYGIRKAKGNYISLLDSDDFYDLDFLKESIEVLENSTKDIGFVWTGVRYKEKGRDKEFIWEPSHREENTYHTFLNSLHIGTNSGLTFKKELFELCGVFREDLPAAEDTEFFLRVSQHYGYAVVKKVLVNIQRDSTDRLSENYKKIADAYNLFLPAHFPFINKKRVLQEKYYYKMMWLNYHLGNIKEARKYYSWIPGNFSLVKLRSLFISILYELFPLVVAFKLHKKISALSHA